MNLMENNPIIEAACSVCSGTYELDTRMSTREDELCPHCKASGRGQAIAYCLSRYVFKCNYPLNQVMPDKNIKIIGLSDGEVYASILKKKCVYTNTYYHKKPFLDITQPDRSYIGKCDAIISADVFEHVIAHPFLAFKGAYDVLKPKGHLILTVPYHTRGPHKEHYPGLKNYTSEQRSDGSWAAHLEYIDGRKTTELNPCFHGGPGATLEIRLFNLSRILEELTWAGFRHVIIQDDNIPECGVNWSEFSRIIVAQK